MADQETFATQPEDTRNSATGGASGFAVGDQVCGRYVVDGALGRGSSGEVLSVRDLSLDRTVAMKVLRGAGGPIIARFMREARMTARIDHPNVPPVHLLEFLPDGGVLFTMRRLDGTSLGEALRQRLSGTAPKAVASTNAIVQVVQRVCDALGRAHALGIVHRDVKPDNIMLGAHGDVALVDWGECRLLSEDDTGPAGSTVGTPAYMSPEQARGEPADQRSDIYALGATLYHALTGHLPTWDADPERFWERKRSGHLDPLPEDVEAALPRHLLAIVRRCLAAAPEARYASAQDLADDLDRFQAGLAVAAYREGALERLARWLRRHRILVGAALALIAIAGIGALLIQRERERSLAGWGEPVVVEDFTDDSWRERWHTFDEGVWEVSDGELVTKGPHRHFLVLRKPLTGAVAIEYDGRFLPQARPGDLSGMWTEAPTVLAMTADEYQNDRSRSYWLQAGAFDNHFCAIMHRTVGRLDKSAFRIEPDRSYHFRVELDGRRLRMLIDGQVVTDFEEELPIGTGRIGLYAYYAGKAFRNLKVYQREVPELLPATAIGDAFLDQRQYQLAGHAYQRAATSLAGTPIAEVALYRQGLAARQAGDAAGCKQAWDQLTSPELRRQAEVNRLDDDFRAGKHIEACEALVRLRQGHDDLRYLARSVWQTWAEQADGESWEHRRPEVVAALIDARRRAFASDHGLDDREASLLLRLGRHAEVVRMFPDEVFYLMMAMHRLGRHAEIAQRIGALWRCDRAALLEAGDLARLLATVPAGEHHWILATCLAGGAAEALERLPQEEHLLVRALDPAEVLARNPPPQARASALAGLGRWDEAKAVSGSNLGGLIDLLTNKLDRTAISPNPDPDTQAWSMVANAEAGDLVRLAEVRASLARWWPDWSRWRTWLIIEPSVLPAPERQTLLRSRLEEVWSKHRHLTAQRAWHLAGFALGHLDEAALAAMPAAGEAPLWTVIGRALRADLAGDAEAARQAWNDYRRLPWRLRLNDLRVPHPGFERLAQARTASPPR